MNVSHSKVLTKVLSLFPKTANLCDIFRLRSGSVLTKRLRFEDHDPWGDTLVAG